MRRLSISLLVICFSIPFAISAQSFLSIDEKLDIDVNDENKNIQSSSHLVFASLTSLLQQWPNTLYPRGHSLVLGTVGAGTLLYHARKDSGPPPRREWLAFDAEMSYGIMGGWGQAYMNTYVSTRDLRILYVDGGSAIISDSGVLDAESLLIYGHINLTEQASFRGEYERLHGLCELGDKLGFEGIVRMNAGFELMWCNFEGHGVQLVDRINVTDPHNPEINWPPQRPPSSGRPAEGLEVEDLVTAREPPPRSRPSRPARRRPMFEPGPFAITAWWEWQRSATWHYRSPGEMRVKLDYATFLSFYDPTVTSLAKIRQRTGTENQREKHRLLGISDADLRYMYTRFTSALEQKIAAAWEPVGSRTDWGGIAASVLERYGGRLGELWWILRLESQDNATISAVRVRSVVYPALMPYVNMTAYTIDNLEWLEPAQKRCRLAFTNAKARGGREPTFSEGLIETSVEDVLDKICSAFIGIFGDILTLKLPKTLPVSEDFDLEDEARRAIALWRTMIKNLMEWLGWSMWHRCEELCAWDEVCRIPMWPLARLPRSGNDTSEQSQASCMKWDDFMRGW